MDIDYIRNKVLNKEVYINGHEDMRRSAVVIPLVKKNGELYILFEVRSKKMKTQPGDICFPGGRIEDGETPKEAALRETFEELNLKDIEIIKELDITIRYDSVIIHSFLGIVNDIEDLKASSNEVEEVFYIPLSHLITQKPIEADGKIMIQQNEDFPYDLIFNGKNYKFSQGTQRTYFYKYNNYVVWGITAKILKNFLDSIKH